VGFLAASDVRVRGTIEAVERRLTHDGFVSRYQTVPDVDGLPAGEASFLLCRFWLGGGPTGTVGRPRSRTSRAVCAAERISCSFRWDDVALREPAEQYTQERSPVTLAS
jgi:hypothetical protein